MNFLNLAARVTRTFITSSSAQMRTIQNVKDNQVRDVVTQLDMKLHNITVEFLADQLPGCKLLSEEDAQNNFTHESLCKGEWLVVDPLDGSNNYAMGMPHYGYMAAYLNNAKILGSIIVLPEYDQYIVLEEGRCLYAQPLPLVAPCNHGTVYYAYPPRLDALACLARQDLLELIDAESAGVYRYGSACCGLYNLICGRHMAFVGHGIRLWDVIAFLPILTSRKITVKYAIREGKITLLASNKTSLIKSIERILEDHQGLFLHQFHDEELRIV